MFVAVWEGCADGCPVAEFVDEGEGCYWRGTLVSVSLSITLGLG